MRRAKVRVRSKYVGQRSGQDQNMSDKGQGMIKMCRAKVRVGSKCVGQRSGQDQNVSDKGQGRIKMCRAKVRVGSKCINRIGACMSCTTSLSSSFFWLLLVRASNSLMRFMLFSLSDVGTTLIHAVHTFCCAECARRHFRAREDHRYRLRKQTIRPCSFITPLNLNSQPVVVSPSLDIIALDLASL